MQKRFLSMILTLAIVLSLFAGLSLTASANTVTYSEGTYFYFQPGVWDKENARFVAYFMDKTASPIVTAWASLADLGGGLYRGTVPSSNEGKWSHVLFVRVNPSYEGTNYFDGKWNQTDDIPLSQNKNIYTITGWGDGNSPYSAGKYFPVEDGYYLAGTRTNWAADDDSIKAENKFDETATAGSYRLELTKALEYKESFKIAKIVNHVLYDDNWYSAGGGNYYVSVRLAGTSIIDFTPVESNKNDSTVIVAPCEGIKAMSISLDGDIGVNLYVYAKDASETVTFTHGTKTETATLGTPYDGGYKVTAHVAAKEMGDTITATLGSIDTKEVSVKGYANALIDNSGSTLDTLLKAMLVYGEKSQNQFSYNTSVNLTEEELTALEASDRTAINGYVNSIPAGCGVTKTSLVLRTKTIYRLYFGSAEPTVKLGSTKLENHYKDGTYYVDIEVAAGDLLSAINLKIGTDETAATVYPMDYVRKALIKLDTSPDATLLATLTAFYRFAKAADSYFNPGT